ncbi:MAG: pyridoxamine 5'-phosphate oxidase family protein [Tissierellia bacterium]|nr:pyridoxamine 5'-phosphate oxidase family protein [Tissierellia bacterium]
MFREMRRKNQLITNEESISILSKATGGVLALLGDNGYPYTVPMSYVYENGKLYFHCAKVGHKIDAIKNSDKASFCVIERDDIVPEEFTTRYISVVAFGKIQILEDPIEIRRTIEVLTRRYSPGFEDEMQKEIENDLDNLCMLEFDIEHITGKESRELMMERKN